MNSVRVIRSSMAASAALILVLGFGGMTGAAGENLTFAPVQSIEDKALVLNTLGYASDLQEEAKQPGPLPVSMARYDLNGDGKPDYVVILTGSAWGGTRGQRVDAFMSRGNGYIQVLAALADTIDLGPGRTKGVRDLLVSRNIRWVRNGSKYMPKR